MSVNGKTAKASQEIKPGDVIELRFGSRTLTVQVESVSEFTTKADAAAMYRQL